MLMKETRPFAFFGQISAVFLMASIGFMLPVLTDYVSTGLVPKLPTWILSMVLMMISFMIFTAGLILDSVARARTEQLRIHYLTLPSVRQSRHQVTLRRETGGEAGQGKAAGSKRRAA